MTDKELAEEWVKEHWSKNVTELYNTESFQRVKGTPHFYDTNLSEAFLAGLKAKTQWHDLRKDPNDLPERDKTFVTDVSVTVIVYPLGFAMYYFFDKKWYSNGKEVKVDMWCEIPKIEE